MFLAALILVACSATAMARVYSAPTRVIVVNSCGPQTGSRHLIRRHTRRSDFNSSYNRWRREGYPYFWTDQ
jgi:hypothetical protein